MQQDEQDFALRLFGPKQVQFIDNCGPTTFWARLARGEYTALRDGRKVKVPGWSILQRRERLPKAEVGSRRGIRGIPSKASAE